MTPGSVQQYYIDFTGTATYTDILRVYINGTKYNARGGETRNGTNTAFPPVDIINDLISRINNDPAQQDVTAAFSSPFRLSPVQ